jgi:hypothetical protein
MWYLEKPKSTQLEDSMNQNKAPSDIPTIARIIPKICVASATPN